MPPEPPRRKPSSGINVREELAPGAIHPLRPVVPPEERPTIPPPAIPHDAVPRATPVKRTPTLIQSPPPPPMRDKQDSVEVATSSLLAELAAKGEEVRAAEARAEQLRVKLEAAKIEVPRVTAPSIRAVERSERHVAILKVLGALAGILVAGATYLSVRANSVIEPRVDAAQARQQAAKLVADTDHETQQKIIDYLRVDRARRDCLDAQIVSALRRGTGHNVTSLSDPAVEWASQNMAPAKAPVLWANATWFTVSPCASAPAPP